MMIWIRIAQHSKIRVGKSAALLEPLANANKRHALSGQAILANDTLVKMLALGNGKTKTELYDQQSSNTRFDNNSDHTL